MDRGLRRPHTAIKLAIASHLLFFWIGTGEEKLFLDNTCGRSSSPEGAYTEDTGGPAHTASPPGGCW